MWMARGSYCFDTLQSTTNWWVHGAFIIEKSRKGYTIYDTFHTSVHAANHDKRSHLYSCLKRKKKKCRRSWEFKVRVSERGGETLPVWWTPRRCKSASVSASSSVRNVASNWTKRCPVYRKKKQWGTVSHIGVYLGEKTGHRTGKLTHRYAIREPADDRLRFAKVELKAFNCQLFVRADWD